MGRAPCCDKENVKRGPWSPEEDAKLKSFIHKYGTAGNWIALPHKAGLKRCGKSCRLRWLNYLRPNIKHGDFTHHEDNIICSLYATIGSRWSIIAGELPGRTDNDIKNYWNTKLKKKLLFASSSTSTQQLNIPNNNINPFNYSNSSFHPIRNMNNNNTFTTTTLSLQQPAFALISPAHFIANNTSINSSSLVFHDHHMTTNFININSNNDTMIINSDQLLTPATTTCSSTTAQDHMITTTHHHHHLAPGGAQVVVDPNNSQLLVSLLTNDVSNINNDNYNNVHMIMNSCFYSGSFLQEDHHHVKQDQVSMLMFGNTGNIGDTACTTTAVASSSEGGSCSSLTHHQIYDHHLQHQNQIKQEEEELITLHDHQGFTDNYNHMMINNLHTSFIINNHVDYMSSSDEKQKLLHNNSSSFNNYAISALQMISATDHHHHHVEELSEAAAHW